MQGIARTTMSIANTGPATAAGTPGSSRTAKRLARLADLDIVQTVTIGTRKLENSVAASDNVKKTRNGHANFRTAIRRESGSSSSAQHYVRLKSLEVHVGRKMTKTLMYCVGPLNDVNVDI